MDIKKHILSLFENKKCYSCQQDWHFFCKKCADWVDNYTPYCYVCKWSSQWFSVHESCKPSIPYIQNIIVLTHYKFPIIKKLLKLWKYYKKPWVYRDIIEWNAPFFLDEISHENSILVPVPMFFLRRWKRWYNQSEIIAREISKITDISLTTKLLKKFKYSKQQSKLWVWKRSKNLIWTYKCIPQKNISKNIHIYLVDDIVSSSSTLQECAEVLYQSWYKNISAICLASD
jgi:ComF family protein